ncbi:MAG: HEAT repeat domain-containing protein [Elusimicrobia bacterium]|nr:HEAT repeat domain-containing protein [Elusimicrobiota bacterium]
MTVILAALLALAPAARAAEGPKRSPIEEARALFKEGMAAKMRGDFSPALDAFTRALTLNTGMPGLRLARGLTYLDAIMMQSRYEGHHNAELDLVAAVKEAPKNPLALCALALARAMNGDRQGENDLLKAAAVRPSLPAYGHAARGRFELDGRNWKDAVAAYRRAYEASPQDSPLSEWIRREMIVVRDRIRLRREPASAAADVRPEVKFEPEPFLAELASEDAKTRAAAARALGRPGLEEAVEPLSNLLNDSDLAVRATALQSLGIVGEPKAVRAITPLLSDKSKFMRALAARALGGIGSERARKPLDELLAREKEAIVAADAKKALKEIDNAAYNMKMDMELLMEELAK